MVSRGFSIAWRATDFCAGFSGHSRELQDTAFSAPSHGRFAAFMAALLPLDILADLRLDRNASAPSSPSVWAL